MTRVIVSLTIFLALLGIAASVEHLLASEHYNAGFDEHPVPSRIHVILGALYLGLALVQFAGEVRRRWPGFHRVAGRVAVVAGVGAGITALVIAAWFPFGGTPELVITGPFALLFGYALARGLWLARRRRFAEHREWMIRAMAVGTSISTMRLIFVPALISFGGQEEVARWLSLVCFGIAFVIHSTVAELWIRSTRSGDGRAPEVVPRPLFRDLGRQVEAE
ncbi:MAG: DUF2306 domain-containing protein [Myxococcota bacterium]|nr:DUF2306 domain-containing protein [Myxococcota bacterium]